MRHGRFSLRSRKPLLSVAMALFLSICSACITRQEVCIKNAYIIYCEHQRDLDCPGPTDRKLIEQEIGRENFVAVLKDFCATKYRAEAIYCIGCFGSQQDAAVVARGLVDFDPEVRRVALRAFSNLSGVQFRSVAEAVDWITNTQGK